MNIFMVFENTIWLVAARSGTGDSKKSESKKKVKVRAYYNNMMIVYRS